MAGHDRITGTGLGLPIARDLARSMGGDLAVASVPGVRLHLRPGPAGTGLGRARRRRPTTLERVLADEEVALEERAVLRAIRRAALRTRPGLIHESTSRRASSWITR